MRTILLHTSAFLSVVLMGLGGPGCGAPTDTTLIVHTSGLSSDIRTLRVTATLAGARTVKQYATAPLIGLVLPEGASGQVSLVVDGLAEGGCAVATGQSSAQASGEARVDVNVQLVALAAPVCSFSLTVTKNGSGTVISDVGGIRCGMQCSDEFPAGTQVTLTATPDAGNYFAGWSGACNETGICTLTLSQPTQVTATFAPKICSADGFCWDSPTLPGKTLNGVFGTDPKNVWVVGGSGTIRRWNGTTWTAQNSGTANYLSGVWGSDANNVWAVGNAGTILKWTGTAWTAQNSVTTSFLNGVWGSDANNVWAVGDGGKIVKWNGTAWIAQTSGTANSLYGVWGSDANNVWAVGDGGTIRRWNGTTWAAQTSGVATRLYSVWGSDANNVWSVGSAGTILKGNGTAWAAQNSGITQNLIGVWGKDANNVWAVGVCGTILRGP